MKRTIWKSTFREIKQSFGRFAAILAIIALGVAFFAGLKVTKSAMVQTTEQYLEEQGFYDYRLLSTMGFRQEEVEFLQQKEDVQNAEGAISFDIIYQNESGSEGVLKVHSLTEEVNQVRLLKGRMPESADECVVDADAFSNSSMGKTIKLSENNAEKDLEYFAYREYTIVGIVQSPLYIQFERGNTSLGTGKLNGFIYIPFEGFDMDYYTEIYVDFADDFPMYSDEYENFLDGKEAVWEEYASEAAYLSYQGIKEDANQQLADAKEELATEKADAEAELADAEEKLADAEIQLADGESQLAEAKQELADAKKTIAKNEKELADAEREIADKEKELADGEQELADGIAEWNNGKSQLEQAKAELQAGQLQLTGQKLTLQTQESQLHSGEALLQATEAGLNMQKQSLESQMQMLDGQEQQLIATYGEGKVPQFLLTPIQTQREQVTSELKQVEVDIAEIMKQKQELETGKTALAEGKNTISSYEQQMNAGLAQLQESEKELEDAWAEIEANQQMITDGKLALEEAKIQIEEGKIQLADAKEEIAEGEQTLLEKEQEFADAKAEYEDGLREYEDGLAEFNEKIAEAEQKIADAQADIAELEEPDSYLLGRDTNVGYVCFENDSSIIDGIANIFPVFFFSVAALVCITTMNRMVEEQRTQIGVLKALGYSERVIMIKYMFYSGAAAIAGCVIGFVGGTILFPNVIWTAYGMMYRVDKLLYVFDWKLAVISIVVSILCSMGATWMSCRVELKQVAAQLMRPKAPKAGKRVFLEYIPFVWRRLGFLKKVSIRNIFRYKKRLFMMVMGISGCTALLVTGFGVKDSIANVATQQFEEIQIYDISVTFAEELTEENMKSVESAAGVSREHYIPAYESTYDLVTDQGRKSLSLLVFDSETKITPFIDLHTKEKEKIAFPTVGEVVITDKIAETYGLRVGDTVTLQNDDMQTLTMKISDINQNFVYNYAYISSETYEEQLGQQPAYKNIYLNIPEDADAHMISAALMNEDGVANVTVNRDTMERFSSMMASLDLIVVVIIFCAGGLAFIVLYNLTNINITERVREIATIKVLGFNKKETSSYVFRENMVLAALGIAVGLVLGHYLHLFVMNEVKIDMVTFDIHVRPISFLYSVLLTFAFAWFVNQIMGRKLENISMTESLKSVD